MREKDKTIFDTKDKLQNAQGRMNFSEKSNKRDTEDRKIRE